MTNAAAVLVLSTILHVEDDMALRGVVELSFASFGYRGTMIAAGSVAGARKRLEQAAHAGSEIELIISDMNLPDGSGLDVVRLVRASPEWRTTPVLILSGDIDPKIVGKAYALGANAYLDKAPHDRSLSDVLRSAYQHWTHDVVLPRAPAEGERIRALISNGIALRRRHADLYQHLAELFSDTRAEATFWLSRALVESNLINLLAFVQNLVHDDDFPETAFGEIASMQADLETMLSQGERALGTASLTREAAYRLVVDLVTRSNLLVISRRIHDLSPKVDAAVAAFHDFLANTVRDVAAWVDVHATDPSLHLRATELQAKLSALMSQPA